MMIEPAVDASLDIRDIAGLFLIGYGLQTRQAYRKDLEDWFSFCDSAGISPQKATRPLCNAFSASLREIRQLAPSTVARRLSALSSFYSFAVEEGYCEHNPVASVRRPKVGSESPDTGLTADQISALIRAALADGPRAYALVMLLVFTGMRISEALSADVGDLGHERGVYTLKIVRKGGQTAKVPLKQEVYDALKDNQPSANPVAPLFPTARGRLHRADAWKIMQRLAGTHPHALRHSFCTLSLDAGAELHQVQAAMGHKDPRTTQRYNAAREGFDKHPSNVLGYLMK